MSRQKRREHADVDVAKTPAELAHEAVSGAVAELAATAEPTEPAPKARKEPKPKRERKPRETQPACGATKKDGNPCTQHRMVGRETCTDHRPAVEHLTEAEVQTLYDAVDARGDTNDVVAWFVEQLGWGKAKMLAAKLSQ